MVVFSLPFVRCLKDIYPLIDERGLLPNTWNSLTGLPPEIGESTEIHYTPILFLLLDKIYYYCITNTTYVLCRYLGNTEKEKEKLKSIHNLTTQEKRCFLSIQTFPFAFFNLKKWDF